MPVQVLSFCVAEQREMRSGKVQILFADFDSGGLHGSSLPPVQVKTL
jgi:hypothetical protein